MSLSIRKIKLYFWTKTFCLNCYKMLDYWIDEDQRQSMNSTRNPKSYFPTSLRGVGPYGPYGPCGPEAAFRLPNSSICSLLFALCPMTYVFSLSPFSFSTTATISSGIGDSKVMSSPVSGWASPRRQACSICLGIALIREAIDEDIPGKSLALSFSHFRDPYTRSPTIGWPTVAQ